MPRRFFTTKSPRFFAAGKLVSYGLTGVAFLASTLSVQAQTVKGGPAGTTTKPGSGIRTPIVVDNPAMSSATELAKALDVTIETAQQIQALYADKAFWTPAQRKLDSDLIYAARMAQGLPAAPGVPTLSTSSHPDGAGRVKVVIDGNITPALLSAVSDRGGEVLNYTPTSMTVNVPLRQIEDLAGRGDVVRVRRYLAPRHGTAIPGGMAARIKTRPLVPYRRRTRTAAERQAMIAAALQSVGSGTFSSGGDGSGGGVSLPGPLNFSNPTGTAGEGDTVHQAATARSTYGVSGSGIRIGVLSDGNSYMATSQGTNDLPPTDPDGTASGASVTVVVDDTQTTPASQEGPAGNSGEGTAMMEIVHDLAPDAKIFFATADNGEDQFAKNILLLRYKYHCDIIIDDVFYFDEPVFSDGMVTQAVNQVVADGALYFSSAGNEGHTTTYSVGNGSTASCWEGDFVSGGSVTTVGGTSDPGSVHRFATGVNYNTVNRIQGQNGSSTQGYAFLYWSDPDNGSSNDYDLICTDSTGSTTYSASLNTQDGTQQPYEGVYALNTYRLYVIKYSGATRALHLDTFGSSSYNLPSMTYTTSGQTFGHCTAAGAFGVAAAPSTNNQGLGGPYPNPFTTSSISEYFTSGGPRQVFYNVTGGPDLTLAVAPSGYTLPVSSPTFTGVNGIYTFASSGGTKRLKPDITAADGVTSSAAFAANSGLNPFYGTSAAAPHAGAIAALIKSYQTTIGGLGIYGPALSLSEMRTILTGTALDIESAGWDITTGYGIVMPIPAIKYLQNFLNSGSISVSATTTTTATITWTTNLPSSSVVYYGTTTAYGSTANPGGTATAHSVTITGLTPGKLYHFKVNSVTPTNSLAYTDTSDRTFVTAPSSQASGAPIVSVSAISSSRSGTNVTYQVTLKNSGTATATNVRVTAATLGSTAPTQTLPLTVGSIAVNGTATISLTFAGVGSGTSTVIRVAGTDDSGTTFSTATRTTTP